MKPLSLEIKIMMGLYIYVAVLCAPVYLLLIKLGYTSQESCFTITGTTGVLMCSIALVSVFVVVLGEDS